MASSQSVDAQLALAIWEHASDGLFLTDGLLVILDANPRACELLGRTRDELRGRRIAELIIAEDLELLPLRADELRRGIETHTLRVFARPDGTRVILDVAARRLPDGRLLGIARDVTERTRAERRLTESEASFRALAERLPDGVVVHVGGLIVFTNGAFQAQVGLSAEELRGATVTSLVHPDDVARVRARIAQLVDGAATVPFASERIVRHDGTAILLDIGGARIDFEGHPAIVVVTRDLNEQRRLEAKLIETDRLAAAGVLAAGVAHEINNPLAYLLLSLDAAVAALGAHPTAAAAIRPLLAHVREGAVRVRDIVRELRTFTTPRPADVFIVDVSRALTAAIALAGAEVRARAQLVVDEQPMPPVRADEGRLAQVFVNLLLNAAQAIPEDGAVHTITVRCGVRDRAVVVSVEDDGVGIPADALPRIFEPFYTTKGRRGGTGLGLAISRSIIESFDGRIDVDSAPALGTRFSVRLPIASATGEEARGLLEQRDFDVVLCDLTLPRMSGMDLHEWCERDRPRLAERFVFMTGGNATARAAALLDRHPDRSLSKPFDLTAVERLIDATVRRR
jgi:PAS domain S-box-containing protein